MSHSSGPIAAFHDVSKSYDGKSRVVDGLNLEIMRGEFLTLLGPSGSGKTTTLMMLAGFEEPTKGDIQLEGRSLVGVPPHQRNFGVVFQSYALFPHMSVAENLAFPLRMRRLPRGERDQRVGEVLDMVRLRHLSGRLPAQLSGGQKQRVALARALVFEPGMVLLDEPLGALDRQLRDEMQAELKALHIALGITFVHITHDQNEALALSDRVGVLKDGRLLQLGTPSEIYNSPADPFVASFIGENNQFIAILKGQRDGLTMLSVADTLLSFSGCNGSDLPIGTAVRVMVRPEHVRVARRPVGDRKVARGRIADISFRGDHLRIAVDVIGLGLITSKQSAAQVDHTLSVGDDCFLDWEDERARIFDLVI